MSALVAGVGLVGCAGNNSSAEPTPLFAPSTQTPSPTPSVDPLLAEVREIIEGYVPTRVAVQVQSDPTGGSLGDYATQANVDTLASRVLADEREGHRYAGRVRVIDVEIIDTYLDADVPGLVAQVCLDGTGFVQVDADTGELTGVDTEQVPARHTSYFSMWLDEDDQWWVAGVSGPAWFRGEQEEALEQC